MIRRRTLLHMGLAAAGPSILTACATGVAQIDHQQPRSEPAGTVIDLWPSRAPGGEHVTVVQSEVERSHDPTFHDVAVIHTTRPTLTLFRPQTVSGASVLLIPGGGYQRVVVGKEGYEIANWLTSRGIAAFVLLYRLPADGWSAGPDAPLQDAQRAVRLIRRQAPALGLDPNRVAVMGFSAGGHLAARLATRFSSKTYDPIDEADALSFAASQIDDTQKTPVTVDPDFLKHSKGGVVHTSGLPRRSVGEIVVLSSTPTTATGMVVFALEDVHVGDGVELDEQQQ